MATDPAEDPAVTATITPTGVLTVWGLAGDPLVVDEGAPAAARNALINLLAQHAQTLGGPVAAAARTPAGPWYLSVAPTGQTVPIDPAAFAGVDLPDLDPQFTLAGAEAVFAAAQDSPPAATLALASDPDPAIRATAAARLATWADDPTPVADAQLPGSRLEVLAGCSLGWVRAGVAANPGTEPSTLAGLVDDPDPLVRLALAARFDLAPELTVQLASDPDQRVRVELTRNPAASFLTRGAAGPGATGPPNAWRPSAEHPTGSTGPDEPATAAADPPTRSRSGHRGRVVATAALGVVALIGGGYAAVTVASAHTEPTAAAATAPPGTALWNGMALPAGPDGPTDPAAAVATGFAHTEAGAAMAAAHLSVRIDPYAGPASFTPTITDQTYGGDPAALLAVTRARYESAAARAGVPDGQPIPISTGQIRGWRAEGWTPTGPTTVHLRVAGADGTDTDYAITVVWVDTDYALLDPTRADTFTTSPVTDPTTYRSF